MKKITLTLVILTVTATSGFCKPGGWFFDILERSSVSVNSGYYQQPQRCQPAPVYYQQPQYYYRPAPVCYPNTSFEYRGNRGHDHCR